MPTLPSEHAVKGWVKEEWLFGEENQWTGESRKRLFLKREGKTGRARLREGNHSNAMCFWETLRVLFFHSTLFHSCIQLLQPSHRLARAQLSISVTNGLALSLQLSAATQILLLILAAWNIWLRAPSWAPCLKSEIKCRGFFPISNIISLKHMYSVQEISTTLYSLIKALPKKSTCMRCSVC